MTVLCVASEPHILAGGNGRGGGRDPTFEFLLSSVLDVLILSRAGSSFPPDREFKGGNLGETLSSHHRMPGRSVSLLGVLLSLVKGLTNRVR